MTLNLLRALFSIAAATQTALLGPECLAQSSVSLRLEKISGLLSVNTPTDAKIVFHFNKPIRLVWADQPFISIWRAWDAANGYPRTALPDFDGTRVVYQYLSSSNQNIVACSYPGGWPARAEISFTYEGAYLEDLDGNRLGESGMISFETGSTSTPALVLTASAAPRDENVRLTVPTYPGLRYVVQSISDLRSNAWQTIWSGAASGEWLSLTNRSPAAHLFYRAYHE